MQLLNPSTLKIARPAKRILSLVPSLTETLAYLGLDKETVGITKFCVHPTSWFESKQRIGGTKNVDIEKLRMLQPDLVIASKEENVQEQVEDIAHFCPVLLTDIVTQQDAFDVILAIGQHAEKKQEAEKMVSDIQQQFGQLNISDKKKAAYLIWRNPWMVAGGDTYIHQMMMAAGFENVFANFNRYPEVSLDAMANENPEVVLLSSEPYPFGVKHLEEVSAAMPYTKVMLVDGEMFSWYGSRLLKAAPYFHTLHM